MYLLGDFLRNSISVLVNKYKDFREKFSLSTIVKEPTRIPWSTSSRLHHILTNSSGQKFQKGLIHVGILDYRLIYYTRKIKRIKYNIRNQIQLQSFK